MSVLLGLDISSSSTGWAVLTDGKLLGGLNDCGAIRMKQKSHSERLAVLSAELNKILERFKPDEIAVEGVWGALKNPSVGILLGHYHGVCKLAWWCYKPAEPFVYTVSDIRKIVGQQYDRNLIPSKKEKLETGKDGKTLTFELMREVYSLADFKFSRHNDITDGLAVATAHYLIQTNGRVLPPKPIKKTKVKTKKK